MQTNGTLRNTVSRPRAVVLFDLDCFYAQCEHLREPELESLPLGIQQKQIIVTCNYEARKHGVRKLTLVTEALRRCPQLVIRSGEDLTRYRQCSENVYRALRQVFTDEVARVERQGLDELFVELDLSSECGLLPPTETAEDELDGVGEDPWSQRSDDGAGAPRPAVPHDLSPPAGCTVAGDLAAEDPTCATTLVVAAHWAQRARDRIREVAGMTCSAGIATSKMAAKLAVGLNKPNGQAILAPGHVMALLGPKPMRFIPGLGHAVQKTLEQRFQISRDATVSQLADALTKEQWINALGQRVGSALYLACQGIDDSPVTSSSAPTQLSVEDSFQSCKSLAELEALARPLLEQLARRFREETSGLVARRFRLTLRWRGSNARRSATLPIEFSASAAEQITAGEMWTSWVRPLLTRLLGPNTAGFQLTLINVALVNLEPATSEAKSRSISSFFRQALPPPPTVVEQSPKQTVAATDADDDATEDQVVVLVEIDDPEPGDWGQGTGAVCPECYAWVRPWDVEVHSMSHDEGSSWWIA
ncbi:hypothetical protein H9P43_002335 [Blastocladiella emersonii ATCC 22665]|nr:hypothetical protein H9P43_002335 [Blastocladiella emersonii ATCC 22665]